MIKRLSLLLAAAAVVAFAVPAFAQAAPELTIGGIKATVGQTITATSVNATTQTSLGKLACEHVEVHGIVSANTGTTVKLTDDTTSGNTKGKGCKVGVNTIPVENITLTELHTSTVGTVTFKLDFTLKIGAVHCQFHTAGSSGTYVPTASPLVITLTNVDLVGTPAGCEPGTLNGTFTVTSPSGVVVAH